MPRVYDDVSHLRQPYLQTRLGGPSDEAQALGVYMTRGPVDSAPLPIHRGYGVYHHASMRGLGDVTPLAASAQGGAKYQELSPLDAINVETWLSTKAVSLPATPSPDVKTPGSTYVAMSPLDLPVPPGYAPLNVPGALWAAQEVAAGRFIVVANAAWDPDVSNFFASVEPSQIAKQAAPGGNWAVVMKPISAKGPIVKNDGVPPIGGSVPTCDSLGLRGAWPNCEPWPDVQFPPSSAPPKSDKVVAPSENERSTGVPTAAIVVGVAGVALLVAIALKKK